MYTYFFHLFSGFGTKPVSQMNMCHLSQVLVKTEAVFSFLFFFLVLNIITGILSRSTPQRFCCCNHRTFDLNITGLDKLLPIIYCLPKLHKTPIGARFIVASNYCSMKPIADTTSKIFKMIPNAVESFFFIPKVSFIQGVRNSGLCKILFQLLLS